MRRLVLATLLTFVTTAGGIAHADELLFVDTSTGKTAKQRVDGYVTSVCWGPRGVEALVERAARNADPPRVYAAYTPGAKPRIVRRPRHEELIGAVHAPGCTRVAEVHYVFADDPQYGGGILVRDAAGGELLRVQSDGWPEEPDAVWSSDGTRVATLLYERGGRRLRITDATTGVLLRKLAPRQLLDRLVGFSHDKRTLTVATLGNSGGGHVNIDVATGAVRDLIDPAGGRRLDAFSWSPATNVLAARNEGGGIELLDPVLGYGPTLPTGPRGPDVGSLPTWSPDGARIAYVQGAGVVVVDARAGARPRRLLAAARGLEVGGLTWSPDGRHLVAVRSKVPY